MLVAAFERGSHVVGCCLWGGVLCENCIVDAKSFFCLISFVLFCVCFSCGAPPLNAATPVCGVGVGGVFVVRAHGGCLGMSSR